jgi:RNA ligase (TIGR02306 family)
MRQMATIQTIDLVHPHNNAEKLELAKIGGWQCVVEKGQYKTGETVVFCEIDSWIPNEVAPFLSKGKEPREYNGVKGERLRSIKLRGELSQGLILPLSVVYELPPTTNTDVVGQDVSAALNIQKWERPLSPQLAGQAKGYFPSFLRKTDQERIQNVFKSFTQEHLDDVYEVTLKIDGSSMTVFYNNGDFGVCSRNLELKINDENKDNAFIKKAVELGLEEKLRAYGKNIAIQGELWGSGINGNWEGIAHHEFSVFDIFDIDEQRYLGAEVRHAVCKRLELQHTPVIDYDDLSAFKSVQDFLAYAERPSINNKIAEGVVFKSLSNPEYSFKAVSNSYLLNGGE